MTDSPRCASHTPKRPGFIRVFRRELHVIAHSPFYLIFTFILPLASFGALIAIFYQETPRDLPVFVCDNDESSLSRQLTRMIDASPALSVAGKVGDMEEAAALIRNGKGYAILFMPSHLERDVNRGDAPSVTIFYNNQWMLVSGLISRAARDVVVSASTDFDISFREAQGDIASVASEKYEPIRTDLHLLFNPNLNYRYFLLPACMAWVVSVFTAMVSARAVGGELKHGTAGEWLAASGNRPFTGLLAKLLPYTFFFLVLSLFMLALLMRFLDVPMYGSWWVLAVATVLMVLAYQSVATLFVVLTANLRLANSLVGFYTGPALAFGGITFPYMAMPAAAKVWSSSLGLTHYLVILLQQSLRGAPPLASGKELVVLVLFVVVPLVLIAPRLGRVMREPAYWGHL